MFSILRRTIVNKVEMSTMVFESTIDNKVVRGRVYRLSGCIQINFKMFVFVFQRS